MSTTDKTANIIYLIGLITTLIAFLIGCGAEFLHTKDGCAPETYRCEGQESQICNSDETWEKVVNCKTLGPEPWTCCPSDGQCDLDGQCTE